MVARADRRGPREVVRENRLESCYIRPIAFYGSEKMGVSPRGAAVHVAIAAWPWGAYLGEDGLQKGIRVKTSSFARHHINVSMVRSKTAGHYVNSILANLEATRDGYDEALLLDTAGFVAEGAGENLFIVRNGRLIEPQLVSGLTGITRATVIELAGELGIEVLLAAHDARRCLPRRRGLLHRHRGRESRRSANSTGASIGQGRRGPITERLQNRFFDVVAGRSEKHRHWLTKV